MRASRTGGDRESENERGTEEIHEKEMARGRRTGSARARESGDYENANGDSARVRVTEDPREQD